MVCMYSFQKLVLKDGSALSQPVDIGGATTHVKICRTEEGEEAVSYRGSIFQVDFFAQFGILSFWQIFNPFLDPPGPGMAPGWGIKVPNTSFPIAWGML